MSSSNAMQKIEANVNNCINILLKEIIYTFKYNNLEIYCIKTNKCDIWFGAMEVAKGLNYKNINQILKNKVNDEDKKKLGVI